MQPVTPRPASPPRVGLLLSAHKPPDESDERWIGGLKFAPEGCNSAGVEDPCEVEERDISDSPANVEFEPFLVWAGDKCSTFGFQSRDYRGRAERMLAACEGAQVESEFWKGTQAQESDWPNAYLTSEASDVITTGSTNEMDVLALHEQALAECNCGQQGMIHAPRSVVSKWAERGVLRREGNRILTINDTIVVPGAGYDGSGPYGDAADGSVWTFSTGMVEVRLSAVKVVPDTFEQAAAAGRGTNIIEIYAQREAAATWDGCCHFAAEVDAPVPAIGGQGS